MYVLIVLHQHRTKLIGKSIFASPGAPGASGDSLDPTLLSGLKGRNRLQVPWYPFS